MDRLPGIRPRRNVWQQIDAAGRMAFPAASTLLLLVALSMKLDLPGQSALRPAAVLACVFFWSLHRPRAMPALLAFLLALLGDLLGQAPPGIGILGVLTAQGIALRWRRVLLRQDFLAAWIAFGAVALIYAAIVWMLDSLFAFVLLPPDPALLQALLAAGLFPVLSLLLLLAAHRGLADPDRA